MNDLAARRSRARRNRAAQRRACHGPSAWADVPPRGSNVERARVNVQRRLKHAMQRIAEECPAAGKHLEWAIRTGSFCSYRPR